jgi:methionine-rich copper-binding protein CopC
MNAGGTRMMRVVISVGAVAATVLMTAAPASAHARVLRTTPGNGTTSDGRLKVISVVFDDPVRVVPRSLVVTGATGAPQTIGAPRILEGRVLQAKLSDRLPAGRYFVGWRILADDGHIESGSFGFSVVAGGGMSSSAAGADSVPPAPAEPVWPVVVAAAMAALAVLGAAVVVIRGLSAVRAVGAPILYPDDVEGSRTSARDHPVSQR